MVTATGAVTMAAENHHPAPVPIMVMAARRTHVAGWDVDTLHVHVVGFIDAE